MKKMFFPLTLLLAFSAINAEDLNTESVVQENTVPASTDTTAPEAVVETVEVQPIIVVVTTQAPVEEAPVVEAPLAITAPTEPVTAPVVIAVAAAHTTNALPNEDDINQILTLLNAYNEKASIIKKLQDLAAHDSEVVTLDERLVRSLLVLLETHKKEADLIAHLRTELKQSFASIQALLNSWDGEAEQLLAKKQSSKPMIKHKPSQKRDVDYEKIKQLNKDK